MPVRTLVVSNANLEIDLIEIDKGSVPITIMEKENNNSKSGQKQDKADGKRENMLTGTGTHSKETKTNEIRRNKDMEKGKLSNSGEEDKTKDGMKKDSTEMLSLGTGIGIDKATGGIRGTGEGKIDSPVGNRKTTGKKVPTNDAKKGAEADNAESRRNLPKRVVGWRRCIHILLFLFLFGNDIADFISDWLFFTDVVIAERGLVYGPPEEAAVWCLLLFSIIGTFTFCFECVNLWLEFFRNNSWVDSDCLSAIVIWIEDVPQIIISMYLILCREEPISIFQLLKAAVILIGVFIRIVVTSVKYCNKQAIRSHHHVKIKAAIMLGIIIESMCAGAIFFLTQTERNHAGDVSFRVPSTLLEDSYDDQRYFRDVSVFLRDANLAQLGNPNIKFSDPTDDWIRLATILSIREGDQETPSFKIEYAQSRNNRNNLAISERQKDSENWTLSECYTISSRTKHITQVPNITCAIPGYFTNSAILFIKLKFEKPGSIFKKKIFGDIQMNVQKLENGICTSITDYADSFTSRFIGTIPISFHYYRTNVTVQHEDIKHLLYRSGTPYFYSLSDMVDIDLVWKTGWRECESSGHRAPIYDKDLTINCF